MGINKVIEKFNTELKKLGYEVAYSNTNYFDILFDMFREHGFEIINDRYSKVAYKVSDSIEIISWHSNAKQFKLSFLREGESCVVYNKHGEMIKRIKKITDKSVIIELDENGKTMRVPFKKLVPWNQGQRMSDAVQRQHWRYYNN